MSSQSFAVVVSSGDSKPSDRATTHYKHRWTDGGVAVETDFTGGHLLNLAVAGCVLNDVHREAEKLGVPVDGVRVSAWGDFNRETWQSTGINYTIEIVSTASPEEVEHLVNVVDEVAEIPKTIRMGASVSRIQS